MMQLSLQNSCAQVLQTMSGYFYTQRSTILLAFHDTNSFSTSTLDSDEIDVFMRLVIQENEQKSQKVGKPGIFH